MRHYNKFKSWFRITNLLFDSLMDELIIKMIILESEHVSLQKVEATLIHALVAGEDRRFYHHKGFDPQGILRAIWVILYKKKLQGASTIEQQLVRTVTNRRALTFSRKLGEIAAAIWLSANFEKDTLATIYLRHAYYGWRMKDLEQARQRLHLTDITLNEDSACDIVAYLRYPCRAQPNSTYIAKQHARSRYIKHCLRRPGWLLR
jgi:membrane peptidoglycan carboxypeptidase